MNFRPHRFHSGRCASRSAAHRCASRASARSACAQAGPDAAEGIARAVIDFAVQLLTADHENVADVLRELEAVGVGQALDARTGRRPPRVPSFVSCASWTVVVRTPPIGWAPPPTRSPDRTAPHRTAPHQAPGTTMRTSMHRTRCAAAVAGRG
ncbi:hypothetical protein OG594_22925 [Streptomyces sp. NBC_01214]|uniref:hypothetical protein n=1 Tax=Streptomyces sp. NBC_01214 TaxID=2903777 RepID=UPI00224D22BD|nr:hypothetical protein [Streptomyces sp. NBC_01214]MCX4804455.1 hypothetical protein [Streptomyces sp. NBC_01214]